MRISIRRRGVVRAWLSFACLSALVPGVLLAQSPPETITQYVNACRDNLGFQGVSIPDLNCFAEQFAPPSAAEPRTDDWFGYLKVNDKVDLAFACRWLQSGGKQPSAQSAEMIIHNRESGSTCFLSAKENGGNSVGSLLKSPTGPEATTFWRTPAEVDANVRCVNCHVSGPYIATPRIAPFLAKYGLLNNGHPTFDNVNDLNWNRYHAIGATFGPSFRNWDNLMRVNQTRPGCAMNCHVRAVNPPSIKIEGTPGNILLPGINEILTMISTAGAMPPFLETSDYRWINRDSADLTGDIEKWSEAQKSYPDLLSNCPAPGILEAREIGRTETISTGVFPDILTTFNINDGLVCENSKQNDNLCNNYQVTYECTDGTVTEFNADTVGGDAGDDERRSRHGNVCPNGGIVARVSAQTTVNGITVSGYLPKDRLAQFTPQGLTCNHADQANGQCSNYVVRYKGCVDAYTAKLRSAWSPNRVITATGTPNNSETRAQPITSGWNTQDWIVEGVYSTGGLVRIRNKGTDHYLQVQANTEGSKVVMYDMVPEWGAQLWFPEPVAGSSDVRLRNIWTGRYLTVQDNGSYAAVLSQTLNNSWVSQRWQIVR
ncbi:MAG: RICIN domain-containing protein [Pseudomonadota bacterium]